MNPVANQKIRLFLADVDGTLVTQEKVLTKRAIEAVHKLHEAGITFAITSGRPPKGMEMLIEPLNLRTPIPGFNGGLIAKTDFSILEQHVLPSDVTEQAIETIKNHGLDAWIYRGNDWFITKKDAPHVAREEWTVKFPPKIVKDYEGLTDDVVKVVGVSDDLDAVAKCEADARSQLGKTVSAARSQPYYLDVTHPQANKGVVIEWMSKHFGIPLEEIATIGDQPSDVAMFEKSGLSIAVANASKEVQGKAIQVSTSNEEEGFANAVERFILS